VVLGAWQSLTETLRAMLDELALGREAAALRMAHDNARAVALAQRASATDIAVKLCCGLWAGHRHMAVAAVGCQVPGGRYAHVASALMSVATARAAGMGHIAAVTPPRPRAPAGVPDAVLFALQVASADRVLVLGGVQGVAALACGLFGLSRADILAGPGNPFVAEAKRLLFGPVGIDIGGAEPCAAQWGGPRATPRACRC